MSWMRCGRADALWSVSPIAATRAASMGASSAADEPGIARGTHEHDSGGNNDRGRDGGGREGPDPPALIPVAAWWRDPVGFDPDAQRRARAAERADAAAERALAP